MYLDGMSEREQVGGDLYQAGWTCKTASLCDQKELSLLANKQTMGKCDGRQHDYTTSTF